ncbi:MAG: MBL fold metallo-hydrolase [Bacteroidaceae bacterium]
MRITILGSGTSTGVPEVGCACDVCQSTDKRDKRFRTSAWIEVEDKRLLIDCGPDFRMQMLNRPFKKLDAVLITHEHYDHVGGLDDLRPFCRMGDIPICGDQQTLYQLKRRMDYCFTEPRYPGIPTFILNSVTSMLPFTIADVEVLPFTVMHGKRPILGFRIGKLAYITDMLTLPDASLAVLDGVECLVMNALRHTPHPTHQSLSQALHVVEKIAPKETYLIHLNHQMGKHAIVDPSLPPHIHLAYDGLVIDLKD